MGVRSFQKGANAMSSTSHSHPSDFFFQMGPTGSKRILSSAKGQLVVTNTLALVILVITFKMFIMMSKEHLIACPSIPATLQTLDHPIPSSYPATQGLMFGPVGMGVLRVVKYFKYHSWGNCAEYRGRTQQRILLGSSRYRPFLLSGYFPSLRCGFGTRSLRHSSHFWGRVERRTEEGFRTISYKDAPLSAPDLRGGAVKQGEKLPAFCLLGRQEMMSALLPVYSPFRKHMTLSHPPQEHHRSCRKPVIKKQFWALLSVSPSQLLEIAVRAVSIDLISKEINL